MPYAGEEIRMKQRITDIAGQLTLLAIDKVESVDHFSNEYDEYTVFQKMRREVTKD